MKSETHSRNTEHPKVDLFHEPQCAKHGGVIRVIPEVFSGPLSPLLPLKKFAAEHDSVYDNTNKIGHARSDSRTATEVVVSALFSA